MDMEDDMCMGLVRSSHHAIQLGLSSVIALPIIVSMCDGEHTTHIVPVSQRGAGMDEVLVLVLPCWFGAK